MRFSLRTLRQRDLTLVIMVVTLLLGLLWYFYMFRPASARISELESQLVQLNEDIRIGESARDNIAELEASVAQAEQAKADFLAALPLESEVADLIDELRLGATGAGVSFTSVSKGGSSDEQIQGVRPIGFTVATAGNYPDTMSFLTILESLQRFTKIRQVGLSVEEEGVENPGLNATYDFTVYVYTGESAPSEAAAPSGDTSGDSQ